MQNTSSTAVVTATYKNGTNWYRKYSDDWKEQGGYYASNSGHVITVPLPIAFSDTNYTVIVSRQHARDTTDRPPLSVTAKGKTYFQFSTNTVKVPQGINWIAFGY